MSNFIDPLMREAGTRIKTIQDAYAGPMDTLNRLIKENAVEIPDRPNAAVNPYASLGTALGMAVTGQGAQYAGNLAATLQQEARRQDAFETQKLQALNYEKLRLSRLAQTTAGLQAEMAGKVSAVPRQVAGEAREARQREITNQRLDDKLELDRKTAQSQIRLREAQLGAMGEQEPETLQERLNAFKENALSVSNGQFVPNVANIESVLNQLDTGIAVFEDKDGNKAMKSILPQPGVDSMGDEERLSWLENQRQIVNSELNSMLRNMSVEPDVAEAYRKERMAPFEAYLKVDKDMTDGPGDVQGPSTPFQEQLMDKVRAEEFKRTDGDVERAGTNLEDVANNPVLLGLIKGASPEIQDFFAEDINDRTPDRLSGPTREMLGGLEVAGEIRQVIGQMGVRQFFDDRTNFKQFKGSIEAMAPAMLGDDELIRKQSKPGGQLKVLRTRLLEHYGLKAEQLNENQMEFVNKAIEKAWGQKRRAASYRNYRQLSSPWG